MVFLWKMIFPEDIILLYSIGNFAATCIMKSSALALDCLIV